MGDFRVTLEDGGLIRRLMAADAVIADEVEAAIRSTSGLGAQESRDVLVAAGRVDTRGLLDSIVPLPIRRAGRAIEAGWAALAPHAIFVRRGRRAGAPMPPQGVLLPWMARHGIPAEAEYPVRRAIARRGIPALDFLGIARDRVEPRYHAAIGAALRRALTRIAGGAP